jgi:hypothetical protein
VRDIGKAPIKSFSRSKIARIREIDPRRSLRGKTPGPDQNKSTLERFNLTELFQRGV